MVVVLAFVVCQVSGFVFLCFFSCVLDLAGFARGVGIGFRLCAEPAFSLAFGIRFGFWLAVGRASVVFSVFTLSHNFRLVMIRPSLLC